MPKKRRLTEIIVYEHPSIRVEIFHDNHTSTVEAKQIANQLICEEKVKQYKIMRVI